MTAQSADVAAPPRYVFTTYIRSTPERIWQALTDSDFTVRYYYNSTVHIRLGRRQPVRVPDHDGAARRSRARSSRPTRPAGSR